MKKHSLILALGLASGAALTAQAQIDITVNGTEYAITEVTGGYQNFYQTLLNNPFYTGYYNENPTLPASFTGLNPGPTTYNGSTLALYSHDPAADFAAAYHAAGGDTSAVFAYWLSATASGNGAPSAVEYITSLPQSVYQNPTYGSYATTEFAVATVVVPEPSDYGWAGASLLMVCGLAGTASRMKRTHQV